MKRRRYLLGVAPLLSGGSVGCLSNASEDGDGSDLAPPVDRDVETVAAATFAEDATPICAAGEPTSASVEGPSAESVADHEFVRDPASGRYGVRGRIEPGSEGLYSVRAEFSDGSSAYHRIRGLEADEAYLFTITSAEGDPDAIDRYVLDVDGGGTADVGTVWEGYATIDGRWGQIGTHDGEPVYGYVAEVTNERDEDVELYPRCKAYLDETTVAYSGGALESSIDVSPGETRTVHFSYPRCDPGAVTEVDAWLEWSTLNNP